MSNFMQAYIIYCRVYEIEKMSKMPNRFRFPSFETLHWFASQRILQDLTDINDENTCCPSHLLTGAKSLIETLRKWAQDKEVVKFHIFKVCFAQNFAS